MSATGSSPKSSVSWPVRLPQTAKPWKQAPVSARWFLPFGELRTLRSRLASWKINSIHDYAADNGISLDSIHFVCQASEVYLPRSELSALDLVLLDGKHAFPWPMVDWFYSADRLKQGGL
jgi:hypothetical protein